MNLFKNSLVVLPTILLVACGFHLRGGVDDNYKFPYKTVYLDCSTPAICDGFRKAITNERLTKLVSNKESAEAIILVDHEETNRATYDFNSVGQINNIKLTYEITATIFDNKGGEKTFELKLKKEVAKDIVEKILTLMK